MQTERDGPGVPIPAASASLGLGGWCVVASSVLPKCKLRTSELLITTRTPIDQVNIAAQSTAAGAEYLVLFESVAPGNRGSSVKSTQTRRGVAVASTPNALQPDGNSSKSQHSADPSVNVKLSLLALSSCFLRVVYTELCVLRRGMDISINHYQSLFQRSQVPQRGTLLSHALGERDTHRHSQLHPLMVPPEMPSESRIGQSGADADLASEDFDGKGAGPGPGPLQRTRKLAERTPQIR